ncbi:MAG: aminotransferase class I/II-fold pyridoxal phosphate-dependent enzyme [Bacteroidota bacterium]|nr:aminotransferase class I/II-fold pyridoxal phosphate-dependent enzyme [Bacteroidota bacterium]
MHDDFKRYFNPEEFREQGHKLIDQLADYLNSVLSGSDQPVLPWESPEEQYDFWYRLFEDKTEMRAEEFYSEILKRSIHLHHPRYIGHQVVPPLPQSALTELVEALTNNSMAVYEVGPASTAIEKVVIDWLKQKLGYGEEANGLITSGGSLGNLTALLAARQDAKGRDVWKNGLDGKLAIMVSSESHYSNERAARIMGLGDENIIQLPVKDHKIDVDQLPHALEKATASRKKVFALLANACSTATGTYDPLVEIAEFCRKHKIWLHVDAAHGGPAIFSKKYRHFLEGIDNADSIVLDFHKMMLTPALTTAVLFRKGETSYQSFQQRADYLLSDENQWFDIAKRSIECTKKPMALKVYLMIKTYGEKLFTRYIEHTFHLAREFADLVKNNKNFELATEPESNIVCFRLLKEGYQQEELNRMNAGIREKIIKNGKYYIVQTSIGNKLFLRLSIMNPFTSLPILQELLKEIESYAKS